MDAGPSSAERARGSPGPAERRPPSGQSGRAHGITPSGPEGPSTRAVRSTWRVGMWRLIIVALVAGLGMAADATAAGFWLPPDFGSNNPNVVVAVGDSI